MKVFLIEGIANRIRTKSPKLSVDDSTNLVLDFIRSSQDVKDFAVQEKYSGRRKPVYDRNTAY